MKSKYKWPCGICGKFTNEFTMVGERLVCPKCMTVNGGRKELKEPIQLSIDDMFYLEERKKKYEI